MNNKGFTLVEILITLVLISILTLIVGGIINTSLATSKEESYEMIKQNIITASETYINECKNKLINCDFSNDEDTEFYAKKLMEYGYLKKLKSPIDGSYLGECIEIKVTYDNGSSIVELIDNCNH